MSFEGVRGAPSLKTTLAQFLNSDPQLRLNRAAQSLSGANVQYNPDTWVSSNKRNGQEQNEIIIGGKPLPSEVASRWKIGTEDINEQLLIKTAHELAHQYQHEKGYESALVAWLNGSDVIDQKFIPYLELYAVLAEVGRVSGLSTEKVYSQQSERTGNLKVEILEDITELIGAYLISDEYLNYKLEHSASRLNNEQMTTLATKVVEICQDLE